MNNPSIIKEIRKYREEHARRFGFDLGRIVEDAQQTENKLRAEGWNVVTLKATRQKPEKVLLCRESDAEYSGGENNCKNKSAQVAED